MMLVCPTLVVYAVLAVELSVLAAMKLYRLDGCLSLRPGKHNLKLEQPVLQCRII